MTYTGDAHIELQTSIQANPLSQSKPALDILASQAVFAAAPLIVPMRLKLSDLKLKAIIVLVISRHKGITLVFKNDPLESVNVSSSFDSVSVIQGYIQRSIEGQLREMFRSDLPGVIHRLSQRWLAETSSSTATGQHKPFTGGFSPGAKVETRTPFASGASNISEVLTYKPACSMSSPTKADESFTRSTLSPSELADQSVAESISSYDPTYGMRPEGIPHSPASFKDFAKLSDDRNQGMSALLASPMGSATLNGEDDIHPHDSVSAVNFNNHSADQSQYEMLPAIGGGYIARPRVLHAQSQIVIPTSHDLIGSTESSAARSITGKASGGGSTVRAASGPIPPQVHVQRPSASRQFSEPLTINTKGDRRGSWQSSVAHQSVANSDLPPPYSRPSSSRNSSYLYQQPQDQADGRLGQFGGRSKRSKTIPDSPLAKGFTRAPLQSSSSSISPLSRTASSPLSRSASYRSSSGTVNTPMTSLPSSRSLSPLVEKVPFEDFSPEKPKARPQARPISPPPLFNPSDLSYRSTMDDDDADASRSAIVLDSSRNDSCAHIATLADQFQTLSPFTRPMTNFTARSVPPHMMRRSFTTGSDFDKLKPKRKRMHRVGSAAKACKSAALDPDSERNDSVSPSPVFTHASLPRSDSGNSMASMSDYFPHIPSLKNGENGRAILRPPSWHRQASSSQVGLR